MDLTTLPSRNRWIAATWLAIGAVLLVAVLAFASTKKWREYREASGHSRQVLAAANTVMIDLLDAETAQRGYLLTGDTVYLEPRRLALIRIGGDTTRLRALTRDNEVQASFLQQLYPLVDRKLAELHATIELRDSGNSAAAADMVRTGRGKAIMDSARTIITWITTEENKLLTNRLAEETGWGKAVIMILLLGAGIVIAAVIYLSRSISSYLAELSVTEMEMERQMGELERYAKAPQGGGAAQ